MQIGCCVGNYVNLAEAVFPNNQVLELLKECNVEPCGDPPECSVSDASTLTATAISLLIIGAVMVAMAST